jgi:hypothetical protein
MDVLMVDHLGVLHYLYVILLDRPNVYVHNVFCDRTLGNRINRCGFGCGFIGKVYCICVGRGFTEFLSDVWLLPRRALVIPDVARARLLALYVRLPQ